MISTDVSKPQPYVALLIPPPTLEVLNINSEQIMK